MNNLFAINEEEKNRILILHETATKNHYLIEQNNFFNDQLKTQNKQNQVVVQGQGNDPYQYMKWSDKLWYAKKIEGNTPKWKEAKTQKAIDAIKTKIYGIQPTVIPNTQKINKTTSNNFKLEPELNTVDIDNTRVGNGRERKITDIKKVLNDLGPAKKSTLPLHIRAIWDYMVGRTEPFTSADLTREEQKFLKKVVLSNPNKGLNYDIWKSNGAGNLPTAMSTGSSSEAERLKKSGGQGSLINPELGGQFMYFLGNVAPSNAKESSDKKTVVVNDNYDMNNSDVAKDKEIILKDFAKQVGKFALGDAALYSVIRQTAGLKELAGYKGYPVNLTV
jgi:hypothetical protein